ncbi:hypothetical protein ACH4UT_23480 [Streptomyces sp. NPDC020799]|uniref:hypothetical protein n=1 Tax=Streptomyces sp. NPDC020799 TaxID=3365091 RepID=UPI00347358D5
MSHHRENITWQSETGTWSIGFFDYVFTTNPSDEDHDPEWDVEYVDAFNWVSTGHHTADDALDAYLKQHANPGGTTLVRWSPENTESIAQYETLAADYAASPRTAFSWL